MEDYEFYQELEVLTFAAFIGFLLFLIAGVITGIVYLIIYVVKLCSRRPSSPTTNVYIPLQNIGRNSNYVDHLNEEIGEIDCEDTKEEERGLL